MALKVQKASAKSLPGEATDGFRVMDGNECVMFFHWHKDGEIKLPVPDVPKEVLAQLSTTKRVTTYEQVLDALPERLEQMGYKNEVNVIVNEVTGMFGKGK